MFGMNAMIAVLLLFGVVPIDGHDFCTSYESNGSKLLFHSFDNWLPIFIEGKHVWPLGEDRDYEKLDFDRMKDWEQDYELDNDMSAIFAIPGLKKKNAMGSVKVWLKTFDIIITIKSCLFSEGTTRRGQSLRLL